MYNKEEIIEGLGVSGKAVSDWIREQADEKFIEGPEGKWQTCQHLDHLQFSAKSLGQLFSVPKLALRARFGKPNREGRDYETVRQRYHEKLALADLKDNPAGGKVLPLEEKTQQLDKFDDLVGKLQKGLSKWSEKDLDNYLAPHPLLGKMTIRELMLWTVYHHYHHLETLKAKY